VKLVLERGDKEGERRISLEAEVEAERQAVRSKGWPSRPKAAAAVDSAATRTALGAEHRVEEEVLGPVPRRYYPHLHHCWASRAFHRRGRPSYHLAMVVRCCLVVHQMVGGH